jgi:hypothetical protein
MLGIATPEQTEAKAAHIGLLEGQSTGQGNYMLSGYIDAVRLERAKEIKDIEIIEVSSDKIVADVSGYSVYIDQEKRFILHDCGDWRRTARERRFCKHIGALMLALPEDVTRVVLEGIKRQQWEFSQYTGRERS